MKKVNKVPLAIVLLFVLSLLCGCVVNNNNCETEGIEKAAPTDGYYENCSKDSFYSDVKTEKEKYSKKKDTLSSNLYELSYYFDFDGLPDEFCFEKIIVTSDCNAIDVQYKYENEIVDVFWFRAIDDSEYDFIKYTRQLFSNYESCITCINDLNVLKIIHPKSSQCVEPYNQYTFNFEGNNLEVSVPESLLEEFGEDIFLKIVKMELE